LLIFLSQSKLKKKRENKHEIRLTPKNNNQPLREGCQRKSRGGVSVFQRRNKKSSQTPFNKEKNQTQRPSEPHAQISHQRFSFLNKFQSKRKKKPVGMTFTQPPFFFPLEGGETPPQGNVKKKSPNKVQFEFATSKVFPCWLTINKLSKTAPRKEGNQKQKRRLLPFSPHVLEPLPAMKVTLTYASLD
jgi:hypothetical protein